MQLSVFKAHLQQVDRLQFLLPNGQKVPAHFHLTEVGKIGKTFVDCGGVMRTENVVSIQLWTAQDVYHRLSPQKLLTILDMATAKLSLPDVEIEVEYQGNQSMEKYGLEWREGSFALRPLHTDCLAKDKCGIPASILPLTQKVSSCCEPGSGCC